jgi:3-deoxy-7-phosphoheptulonate synthase
VTLPSVQRVSDKRIDKVVPLVSPALLHHELPLDEDLSAAVV